MKKLFVTIVVAGVACWSLSSCGSKKEEAKEEAKDAYGEYETAEPKAPSADDLIAQGQTLVDNSDCKTCHHPTNKIVGPSTQTWQRNMSSPKQTSPCWPTRSLPVEAETGEKYR